MSYDVNKIQNYTSSKGVFFFDTMIWKMVISPTLGNIPRKERDYVNFFDRVIKDQSGQIAVSSLLFSEIINLYLRTVAMKMYEETQNVTIAPHEFKSRYRPTQHYKNHYRIICDELDIRSDSYVYLDHDLNDCEVSDAINFPSLDFNDYNYYKICKDREISIVTDDGDFFVPDIRILTSNDKLYNKFIDTKIPKDKKKTSTI